MSFRDVLSRYSNLKGKMRGANLPTALPAALENMCMEVYNKGHEEISFSSTHPDRARMNFFGMGAEFWKALSCKPGEWVFLPHGQYNASVQSGSQEILVVVNVGDAMFKGNTLPSRPEVKKMQFFT